MEETKVTVAYDAHGRYNVVVTVGESTELLAGKLGDDSERMRIARTLHEKYGLDRTAIEQQFAEAVAKRAAAKAERIDLEKLTTAVLEKLGSGDQPALRSWRDEWYRFDRSHYKLLSSPEVESLVYHAASPILRKLNNDQQATPRLVRDIVDTIRNRHILSPTIEQPIWLIENPPFPTHEMVPMANGLVHLPTAAGMFEDGSSYETVDDGLFSSTPDLFCTSARPYEYDPYATCPTWLRYLANLWPNDEESQVALQQWAGYLLTPDTSHHKLLMLLGPTRSGKSTITKVLGKLVGDKYVAAPSMRDMSGQFALQPLIGKMLAVVGDARTDRNTDIASLLERLLTISGEDGVDVNRKHAPILPGLRLQTRFVLVSNELPIIRDSSQAILARLILLKTTKSFVGAEDISITARLLGEIAGIFNWAIAGWKLLQDRGSFVQPQSGRAAVEQWKEMVSPISQFVETHCELEEDAEVVKSDLYLQYRAWCNAEGIHPTSHSRFGSQLFSAFPAVQSARASAEDADGKRPRIYRGIRFADGF